MVQQLTPEEEELQIEEGEQFIPPVSTTAIDPNAIPGGADFINWLITNDLWSGLSVEEAMQSYTGLTPDQQEELQGNFTDFQARPVEEKLPNQVTLPDGSTIDANWQFIGSYENEFGETQQIYVPILPLDDFGTGNFNEVMKGLYGEDYAELRANVDYVRMFEAASYSSIAAELFNTQGIDPNSIGDNFALDTFVQDWARNLVSPGFEGVDNTRNLEVANEMNFLIPAISQFLDAGIDIQRMLDPNQSTTQENAVAQNILGAIMDWGRKIINPEFDTGFGAGEQVDISMMQNIAKFVADLDIGAAFNLTSTFGEVPRRQAALNILGFQLGAPDRTGGFTIDWNKINAWVAAKPTRQRFLDEAINRSQAIADKERQRLAGIVHPSGIGLQVNAIFAQNFILELEKSMGFRTEEGLLTTEGLHGAGRGELRQAIGGGVREGSIFGPDVAERTARKATEKAQREAEKAQFQALSKRAKEASLAPRRTVQF